MTNGDFISSLDDPFTTYVNISDPDSTPVMLHDEDLEDIALLGYQPLDNEQLECDLSLLDEAQDSFIKFQSMSMCVELPTVVIGPDLLRELLYAAAMHGEPKIGYLA